VIAPPSFDIQHSDFEPAGRSRYACSRPRCLVSCRWRLRLFAALLVAINATPHPGNRSCRLSPSTAQLAERAVLHGFCVCPASEIHAAAFFLQRRHTSAPSLSPVDLRKPSPEMVRAARRSTGLVDAPRLRGRNGKREDGRRHLAPCRIVSRVRVDEAPGLELLAGALNVVCFRS